jgi:glutamate/tyrosine decarboxylase-like PLP-dependent enzyme
MVAFMREHVRLARLFGEWVKGSSNFELSAPISMGVVCFRVIGSAEASRRSSVAALYERRKDSGRRPQLQEDELDNFNSAIVEQVNESGEAYLTQTKLRGRTVMRIGLGNVLTTERHLADAWELIRKTARSLIS